MLKFKTRAVLFIYDKQEYKEEVASVRGDARVLATRDNLRVGLVDNQRLIRRLKAGRFGSRLFPPVSMSSLVLRRYDGELRVHDLAGGDDHVGVAQWLNK